MPNNPTHRIREPGEENPLQHSLALRNSPFSRINQPLLPSPLLMLLQLLPPPRPVIAFAQLDPVLEFGGQGRLAALCG